MLIIRYLTRPVSNFRGYSKFTDQRNRILIFQTGQQLFKIIFKNTLLWIEEIS